MRVFLMKIYPPMILTSLFTLLTAQSSCTDLAAAPLIPTTIVQQTFGGKTLTVSSCGECGNRSERVDNFRELQLSFPNSQVEKLTLLNLLEYYQQPELLTGDNQYRCDQCDKLTDSDKTTRVVESPTQLIITLKRFRYDLVTHKRNKLLQVVTLDDNLLLNGFYYKLHAVVIHSGPIMDAGHYYTIARDESDWYKLNDETITIGALKNLSNLGQLDTPYILFYTREDVAEFQTVSPDALSSRLQKVLGIANSEIDQGRKKKPEPETPESEEPESKKIQFEEPECKKPQFEEPECGLATDMEDQMMSGDAIDRYVNMLPLADSEFSTTIDNLHEI